MKEIEKKLRAILKETGWTQMKLADRLNVAQATVSRWFSGSEPEGHRRDAINQIYSEIFAHENHYVTSGFHHINEMVAFCGKINKGVHRLDVRVYYADTDFSGVVYHGRYLEFLERGRTEFLRLCGVHHHELAQGEAEIFAWVVRRMDIDFAAPARIDDALLVETRVVSLSGARIRMEQAIMRDDKLLVRARVEAALVNGEGRPRRFPDAWVDRFRIG
ncbi:MAG: Tol-pal system-associated acyl-CoA thioesterase [Candidatus Tokpelaia hoelldobleri]|uniref:Tol-pal system-associated acyl-CoA thioesterase n=1 Tax=Candidatus Tokpelaia hoelldobleri TaxID=1902579 RepID=A0A1U9JST0_9HYPH|nr:MAG: Tol-pal system-associated acyl-CoA thioesterase [Candidatus Tokpelaia hoelldoblerii]